MTAAPLGLIVRWISACDRARICKSRTAYGAPLAPVMAKTMRRVGRDIRTVDRTSFGGGGRVGGAEKNARVTNHRGGGQNFRVTAMRFRGKSISSTLTFTTSPTDTTS